MKPYLQYANDVLSGKVVVGGLIRKAVERFFTFMDREDLEFKETQVDYVISFISILAHKTGRHNGKKFIPEPWQQWIIACIYGFYIRETGQRLVRNAYIEMARKQGKTAFASALCLFHLIADGESNAEVLLAANSKAQAKVAFDMCRIFTKGIDPKGRLLESFRDLITMDKTFSKLKVLAADDSKLDGYNASMYLLDEYHAAKTSAVKDVLQSSQTMRENPLGVVITTAGFNKLGPCYKFREMCVEILNDLKTDDSIFTAIYSLDENDDWKDESVWVKSNPNLGVTVRLNNIRPEVQKAMNSPSEEVGVRTKTINQWCDSKDVWIPDHYILSSSKPIDMADYVGCDCYAGIDLSSTSDLANLTFMLLKDGRYAFKCKYYLPEEALREKRFSVLYGEWRRLGYLTVTPGNVVDYDYILNDLITMSQGVRLFSVAYDSWNATQFTINAQDRGLPMNEFSQVLGNFNRPTKEFERLILSGQVDIDNNEITRFCFKNVVLAMDRNGNTKPSKQFDEKKIDGVIGILESLGAFLISPRYDYSL